MIDHEPMPMDFDDSLDCGATDMHAHVPDDAVGWFMIAVGAAGSWLAHNFFGLCSLGIMCGGLYVNWRNSEARLARFRLKCFREWEHMKDAEINNIKNSSRGATEA